MHNHSRHISDGSWAIVIDWLIKMKSTLKGDPFAQNIHCVWECVVFQIYIDDKSDNHFTDTCNFFWSYSKNIFSF